MQSRSLLVILSMMAAALACTFACDLLQQAAELARNTQPETVVEATAGPAPPGATVALPTEPSPSLPADSGEIPADVLRQMDDIEREVVQLRGLQPTGPVARGLISPEELRQYVIDDFLQGYTEQDAQDDVRSLAMLGLIDPEFDLFNFYLELYNEQIAGFYDDDLKQMFVVQGVGFGGPERITHAHEYTHALQDQRWNLSEGLGFNDEACEADSEACAAVQALVEGDATLLETRWLVTFGTEQDYDQLREFYGSLESPVFDSAPAFLQEDFIFPYVEGLTFVESFFNDGGWAAVDAVYADPPVSTEQILHPELYPDDVPLRLQAPDLQPALGAAWREIDRDSLGEWFTRLTLLEQLSNQTAETAAAGWGGDYFLVLYDEAGDHQVMVLLSAWDTVRDAHEFYEAFRDYGQGRYADPAVSSTTQTTWQGGFGWVSIEIRGDQTLWIYASDRALADQIRPEIAFPAAVDR